MANISFNNVLDLVTGNLTIRLDDKAGVGRFQIEDSDTFPIFKVTSKGDVLRKGIIGRV